MDAYCKCDKCGAEVKVDTSMILTSNPPKYKYTCAACGNHSFIDTSATYNTPHTARTISNIGSNNGTFGSNLQYPYINNSKKDCSTCIHSTVCKYKEEFMKKVEGLDLSDNSFIRLRCECIYYQENNYNYTGVRDIFYGQTILDTAADKSCSDCDFMRRLQNDGSYVGDSPCDFCSKNPYKLTCTSLTTASNKLDSKKTILNETISQVNTTENK